MAHSGIGLALTLSAIGLADSLNPSLIGVAIYLAATPSPRRRTAAFTAGAFAVTLAGGLLLALGLGDLILSLVPKPSEKLRYALEIAAGILLMIAGVVIWWRRLDLASEPTRREETDSSAGAGNALLLGAGVAGIELLTAFPYFAAIAIIVGSSVSGPAKLFLLVLYNVAYLLPLLAIVVICFAIGNRAAKVLAPAGDWINTKWPIVVAPVAVLVGAGVIIYGIVHLS